MSNILKQDLMENPIFRRLLAVGILIVVVGGITWTLLVLYNNSSARLSVLEKAQARYAQAIGSEGALRRRLENLQGAAEKSVALLSGETVALVGAQLQARLKQIVSRAGGSLKTSQMLPAVTEAALERITVRAGMTVTTKTLRKILYDIETGRPYLFIEEIEVKTVSQRRGGNGNPSDMLNVNLIFHGYRKAGRKP